MSLNMHRGTIADIKTGQCDDLLDAIVNAVKERRQALARGTLRQINVGDDVRFNANIRPTYLRGLTAKVVKVNGSSVKVDIDVNPAYGRFSGARNVRCPATLVESTGKVGG